MVTKEAMVHQLYLSFKILWKLIVSLRWIIDIFSIISMKTNGMLAIDDGIYLFILNTIHCNHIACISSDMKLIPSTYGSSINNHSANTQPPLSHTSASPNPHITQPSPTPQQGCSYKLF